MPNTNRFANARSHEYHNRKDGNSSNPGDTIYWRNENHPAFQSSDYWIYTCHNRRTGEDYEFLFYYVDCGGYYEIDILEYPYRLDGSTCSSALHLLNSKRGGKKICVSAGKEPKTIEEAQSLSESWALYVARYIWTGMTIDYQISNRIW